MSKTPVSMLHELMQRKGIVPQYDLLPSEGIGTHTPTFYYRVTAADVSKIGKARSKKDAKHEAAKLALEAFSEMGMYHSDHITTPNPWNSSTSTSTIVSINAVGILKDFCAENNIPKPDFDLISDIGPPHLRHFTVECKIGTMPGIRATDFTKKKAKQAAAQKMLHRLKDSLPEVIEKMKEFTTNTCTITQDVLDGYNDSSVQNKKKINWGLKVSSYPNTFKKLRDENNLCFDNLWQDIIQEDIGDLQDLCNKLKLKFSLDFKIENDESIVSFISINTEPEFVMSGMGNNKEDATTAAVKSAFEFLKILLK